MALPSLIQAIQARFRGTNNNAWSAVTNALGFGNGGHRQNMPPRLQDMADVLDFVSDTVDVIDADKDTAVAAKEQAQRWASNPEDAEALAGSGLFSALHYAAKASASKDAAAVSATASANQAQRLAGTSTTSNTSTVASKTFTTQADKAFEVGKYVHIQSRGTLNRWMEGRVTAYSGTSLTVAVERFGTTTTAATDWDIYVSGAIGVQGIQGIPGIATLGYAARTSNTQLVTADSAHWYDLTGTFTQTFAAASAIGVDWYVVLKNAGTGDITLDPNGSETIDGLTSFIMYPGEVRLIQCDGAALRSVVIEGGTKTFNSSGNLIWPPGVNGAIAEAKGGTGGGGAGGTANSSTRGNGGGSGSSPPVVQNVVPAQTPGASIVATCGAAGVGGVGMNGNIGNPGTAGGSSSLGSLISVPGGNFGTGGALADIPNAGGSGGAAISNPSVGFASSASTSGLAGQNNSVGNAGGASVNGGGKGGDGGTAPNGAGQAGSNGVAGYITVRFF